MKSVLISIKPKYCELIANGKKTVEVRKTKPKIKTPFKCYIYCTKAKFEPSECLRNNMHYDDSIIKVCEGKGKVIGEFVCDIVIVDRTFGHNDLFATAACLDVAEAAAYCINDKMYCWHISDLIIYDEPKELGEFIGIRYLKDRFELRELDRPPQSWCYVI